MNQLICGDNIKVVSTWKPNYVDGICTDPPYGLEFMGKEWDKLGDASIEPTRDSAGGFLRDGKSGSNPYAAARIRMGSDTNSMQRWHYQWAKAMLRITKPGGFLLCFGGTRTFHRLTCAIEDAGWEIRDCMMWLYGSGFPKSHNISKAIDKAAGAKRRVIGTRPVPGYARSEVEHGKQNRTKYEFEQTSDNAITHLAQLWSGYGTALKPAWEPVLLCEKPLTLIHIFGIMIDEITDVLQEILLCQNLFASDVERNFSAIRAKLEKEQVHTVHESAKINVWENTANARYVANSFIFSNQELSESTKTKESSALQSVKENGNGANMRGQEIPVGEAEDILTKVQDIYMSVITGHIEENIALLWRNISDELLKRMSKFTIKMVIKLITELRTLRSYAIQTTSKDTGNLSPEYRPIIVAMKPLDGTFAHNAERHGVAGLNIDAARIGTQEKLERKLGKTTTSDSGWKSSNRSEIAGKDGGRWPANLVLDPEAAAMLDEQTGTKKSGFMAAGTKRQMSDNPNKNTYGKFNPDTVRNDTYGDSGGASRFFYVAKTSRKERNMGMEDCEDKLLARSGGAQGAENRGEKEYLQKHIGLNRVAVVKNNHPTVKPLALMKYLCTLLKMPSTEQIILDPFMGSGTTGMACAELGIGFIGIEKEAEYCEISAKRIAAISGTTLPVTKNVETFRATRDFAGGSCRPNENLPHISEHRQSIINMAVAKLRRNKK